MKTWVKAFCFVAVFLLGTSAAAMAADVRYTKYNIHAQVKEGRLANASYANYTDPGAGHVIVPAGSAITIDKKNRKGFEFTYGADGMRIRFECHSKRMGMGTDEYIELITSAQPVSFSKLSKLDQKGMKEGKAYVGMTKAGILAALGYPAAHKTPSLDSATWIYWANRYRTLGVDFDASGKVAAVR